MELSVCFWISDLNSFAITESASDPAGANKLSSFAKILGDDDILFCGGAVEICEVFLVGAANIDPAQRRIERKKIEAMRKL